MPLHFETPLLESRALSAIAGKSVSLKVESVQPSGSFKIRGVGYACEQYAQRGARRFISSSGGNAGLAVAYAGRRLGVPVTVVVPQTTTQRAKDLIALEAAEVIVHGASWQEANAQAQSMLSTSDAFLHPFDDPLLWEGHATLIDEAARQGERPDAVIVSVGGGGLLCGVVEGLRRNKWTDVTVIAAETIGAESFAQSLRAGKSIELPAITSIATSLGARRVCKRSLELANEHPIESVVVSDWEAVSACLRFADDHRQLVEPACGASLAVAYGAGGALRNFKSVLIVVCGGVTVPLQQLQEWRRVLE